MKWIKDHIKGVWAACLLFICLSAPLLSQGQDTLWVSGVIRDDATEQPVFGAQVEIKGVASALSDAEGQFKIIVPSYNVTLEFSAEGYQPQFVALRGRKQIDVKLLANALYGQRTTVAYPTGEVKSNVNLGAVESTGEINFSGVRNLEEIVQQSLGGIRTITRSGAPGMGANLFVRGYNSLLAQNQPLILIDGVIHEDLLNENSIHEGNFNNTLFNIDPKDIANITVIKDATALYGLRGANGVILIETVRGKVQSTRIDVHASVGVNFKPQEIPMMNAYDWRRYAVGQAMNSGYTTSQLEQEPWLNDNSKFAYYHKYHNNTNWQDEIYKHSLNQNYYIHVTGGDNIALYSFSLGYADFKSQVDNTGLSRLNARFNAAAELSKKFKVEANIGYADVTGDYRDDGLNAITSVRHVGLTKSPLLNPYTQANYTGIVSSGTEDVDYWGKTNPLALMDNAQGTSRRYLLDMGMKLNYDITDDLHLSTRFGTSFHKNKEVYFSPDKGVEDYETTETRVKQTVKNGLNRYQSIFSQTQAVWDKTFHHTHHLDITAGFRYYWVRYENDFYREYNTGDDKLTALGKGRFRYNIGDNTISKYLSWYGQVNYNLLERYFLSAGISMETSSRLGQQSGDFTVSNQPMALFPVFAAGWLVSSENFMKEVNWLETLKLRFSYGWSGNDAYGDYRQLGYFSPIRYVGVATGRILGNIANPGLKWETTEKMNLGVDLAVLYNRISLTVELFKNKTKDMVVIKSSPYAGVDYYDNDGELENKGFEVALNAVVINTKDWQWSVGASITHYRNKVTSLSNDIYNEIMDGTVLTRQGHALGLFYGYKTQGIFATTAEARKASLYTTTKNGGSGYFEAGDVHFADLYKDGVIDEKDRTLIGDPNPDFTGTVNTRLNWRNWGLDVLFTYSYGNDIYNAERATLEAMRSFDNQTEAVKARWQVEGQKTYMPKAVWKDPRGNARFSDRWIEDGSYVRLKKMVLSYKWNIRKRFLRGLTAYAAADNVVTFTKYLGADPEMSIGNNALWQGIDGGLMPQFRTLTFGVKLDL